MKNLHEYYPDEEWNIYIETDIAQIQDLLGSSGVTTWGQGTIGDTGYFQLVTTSAQHKGDKRLAIVASVDDARRAQTLELSKIRQDSESLPSYFLRGYDCEHKRLSPDGDCLDCGA